VGWLEGDGGRGQAGALCGHAQRQAGAARLNDHFKGRKIVKYPRPLSAPGPRLASHRKYQRGIVLNSMIRASPCGKYGGGVRVQRASPARRDIAARGHAEGARVPPAPRPG
jgi:hypothetical protein